MHPDKTGDYYYTKDKVLNLKFNETMLDYLGFSFNGEKVRIREKSIFKYYTRAYRKIRKCNRESKRYKRKSYRRELYKAYSHLGKYQKGRGNFLTYVTRAQKIFDVDSTTDNQMELQVKRHWKKIQRRLEMKNDD